MEGREVQRHVRAQAIGDPARFSLDLGVRVVQAGYEQGGDLEPDARFAAHVLERVQDRREVSGADAVVEVLAERLQVDVGGVHVAEERAPRLGVDVTGRDRNRLHAALVAGVGDVDRVLGEDDRVVVCECHAAAVEPNGSIGDGRRGGRIGQRVDLA